MKPSDDGKNFELSVIGLNKRVLAHAFGRLHLIYPLSYAVRSLCDLYGRERCVLFCDGNLFNQFIVFKKLFQ